MTISQNWVADLLPYRLHWRDEVSDAVRHGQFIQRHAMRLIALGATVAIPWAVAAAERPSDHPGWSVAQEASALAENVDNAIQACDRQISERSDADRAAQTKLSSMGIVFQDDAPPRVKATTGGKLGPARYHRWLDVHAEIWVVAFTTTPACRVLIFESEFLALAQPEIERLITADGFYKRIGADAGADGDGARTIFAGSLGPKIPVHPVVLVTGLNPTVTKATGLKLAIMVAMEQN